MSNAKAILFDADGVLTLPEELFSILYSRSHGLDPKSFEEFFKNDWKPFVLGKADLKQHIKDNSQLWQWDGTPEELLNYWFKSEDVKNMELIELISTIRENGTHCYLATEQEKYRGDFMKNVMFKDLFDGYFVTAELGVSKTEPEFFEAILETLKKEHKDLDSKDVVFFDDSQSKVDTAITVGIDGCLYESINQLREKLTSVGIEYR